MKHPRWKALFAGVAVLFMLWLLMSQWDRIRGLELTLQPHRAMVALVALVGLYFLDALGWHLILRALGIRVDPRTNIRIWLWSSLARYVPGGIWGYVSRAALCREQGIPLATVSLALYLETLLLFSGALAAGLSAIAPLSGFPLGVGSAGMLALLGGGLLHPRVLALLRYLPGKVGEAFATALLPRLHHLFFLYCYYVLFWIVFGVVFLIFISAFQPVPREAWVPVGASMGLSFSIGYAAFFAPGGIGVRESALYGLLMPYLPETACLLIAIGSRFWLLIGEIISLSLALLLFGPVRSRPEREQSV